MRLPTLSDLDPEQNHIYRMPLNTNVFVSGPPGCGKTVIACHRALAAQKGGGDCRVIMYTNVLAQYTGLGTRGRAKTIETLTKDKWISKYWRSVTGQWRVPNHFQPGQRFHPTDYDAMQHQILEKSEEGLPDAANWGHLVIDEGQDFPKAFYAFLNLAAGLVQMAGGGRPVLTVLADENQRINETNSTLNEIRSSLNLGEGCSHTLRKNYRNTKRIAAFANSFSVGVETGTGTPVAEKDGEYPRVVKTDNIDHSVNRIVRYVRNHQTHEVGVLVYTKPQCRRLYNKLKARLGEGAVQAYMSGRDENFSVDKLEFGKPGRVTVLCYKSAKGLEFDAVFLPELHAVSASPDNEEIFKMTMFVMCTRARSYLELSYQQDDVKADSVVSWIPAEDSDLAKYDTEKGVQSARSMEF